VKKNSWRGHQRKHIGVTTEESNLRNVGTGFGQDGRMWGTGKKNGCLGLCCVGKRRYALD